jgi:hypothetical protein
MRVSLNGYGDPIPESYFDADLSESPLAPDTALKLFLEDGVPFEKASYVDAGYTHFQVWCVGAAGGKGGDILGGLNSVDSLGGAGGGGGLHRVAGLLADLPDSCPVVVGQAGTDGTDASNDRWPWLFESWDPDPSYIYATAGEDGGFSSFNDELCQASGGRGGGPTQAPLDPPGGTSLDDWDIYADGVYTNRLGGVGGQGGCGDQTDPGGGGLGGSVLRPSVGLFTYMPAHDGTWDGAIGKGGGGGSGGHIHMNPPGPGWWELQKAGNGGNGSYSYRDTSVYGSREKAHTIPPTGLDQVIFPGSGGGARVNKLSRYGSRAPGAEPNGVVFIRLIMI